MKCNGANNQQLKVFSLLSRGTIFHIFQTIEYDEKDFCRCDCYYGIGLRSIGTKKRYSKGR